MRYKLLLSILLSRVVRFSSINIGPLVEIEAFIPTPPWLHSLHVDQDINKQESTTTAIYIPVWAYQTVEEFCNYEENSIINKYSCEELIPLIEPIINDLNISNEDKQIAHHINNAYNPKAIQTKNALLAISATIQRYEVPKVIVFGSGYDSKMICAATLEGKSKSSFVLFIEDNESWGNMIQLELNEYIQSRHDYKESDLGRCLVIGIAYDTLRRDWIDYLGKQEQLSIQVISAIQQELLNIIKSSHHMSSNKISFNHFILNNKNDAGLENIDYFKNEIHLSQLFDVVVVDGPSGANDLNPGRMASISAASKLIKINHHKEDDDEEGGSGGIVFVDDIDRSIERIYSHAILRPLFQYEVDVRVSLRPLRYYTNDRNIVDILRPRIPPTKLVDFPQIPNDVG